MKQFRRRCCCSWEIT